MQFHVRENLWTLDMSDRKIKKYKQKIEAGEPILSLFLITLPVDASGLLEVYWYNSFLQPYYKDKDGTVEVIGMTQSRDDAYEVLRDLFADMYDRLGEIDLNRFLQIE